MQAPITYIPSFLDNPDNYFSRLIPLEWKKLARNSTYFEYYCNDQDSFYPSGYGSARLPYVSQPWTPHVLDIRTAVQNATKTYFNTCFIKRYINHKDHLNWRSDDFLHEIDNLSPIAVVSLGVSRKILFRPKPEELLTRGERRDGKERRFMERPVPDRRQGEETQRLTLEAGSLLIMKSGMQQTWQYRIPKMPSKCGEYINLTFLNLIDKTM